MEDSEAETTTALRVVNGTTRDGEVNGVHRVSDLEGVTRPPATSSVLGRLTSVPPREVWPHEAHDFTPWLLQNVDVLSDLIGMDLVLESAEHPVVGFSLDLIGYDESTGEVVIVENQLGQSDHTHLGQIITYAAGAEPTTIVLGGHRLPV